MSGARNEHLKVQRVIARLVHAFAGSSRAAAACAA
jgi:hypothetical protein